MKTEYEILINKFGQELISIDELWREFELLNRDEKRDFFISLLELIQQAKPQDTDIEIAIEASKLKPTYIPCILLRKGVAHYRLEKIINLPEGEWRKSLILLLHVFRVAYQRRFKVEYNNPNKWWYWDLSDEKNLKRLKSMF